MATRQRKLVEPEIVRRAIGDSFVKLNPRTLMRNPVMFVVEVGSRAHDDPVLQGPRARRRRNENVFTGLVALFLWFTVLFANFAEAIAEGRGKAQADTLRKTRSETVAHRRRPDGTIEEIPSTALDLDDECRRGRGRDDPERRRGHRGHRQRRRVGDHRRVGPGDPGVGWRPLGRHRRHPRAVRRDRRAHHRPPGRDVHRPDDRPRRGLGAPEDAERDRAQHPARRAHDHLPARDRHAPAVRDVQRTRSRRSSSWSRCWCA